MVNLFQKPDFFWGGEVRNKRIEDVSIIPRKRYIYFPGESKEFSDALNG